MKTNRILSMAAAAATAFVLGGCESDPAGTDLARVTVHLTDAPANLASAEVEIEEIYLIGGAGEEADGRITLYTGSETYDLLDLQNGVTAKLSEVTVPAGTYSELRLIVGDAAITTEAGASYSTEAGTLKCPSCAQSGLKVKLQGGGIQLVEGAQGLVIDFDVAQSFGHAAGQSGMWIMHPVIRATAEDTSGSITGTVSLADGVSLPACGGGDVTLDAFVPTAAAGEMTLSGTTDEEGDLRFSFVGPTAYTMGFVEQVEFDNGDTLTFVAAPSTPTITVTAGSLAEVDYTITGATCSAAA